MSENLGHSDVKTTGNVYTHVTDRLRRDSADRMEERMKSIVGQIVGQTEPKKA